VPLAFDELPAVVIRERTWVPRELIISEERVRQELTIRNGALAAMKNRGFAAPAGAAEEFVLYEETEGHMIVPRAYSVPIKGDAGVDYRIVDLTGRRGKIAGADAVSLGPNEHQRFDQKPAFEALSAPDVAPHGRMLVLRCGAGKTAIACKGAAARGGRMLWVTPTQALLEQARRDIARWLALDVVQVGWVQGQKDLWRGYGVAVAMLQSLALTERPPAFWEYWDLVVFDEGDVLATNHFHKVGPRFRAERWVLTATPKRPDGMQALFELHTGPTCYEHTEFDLKPECHFLATSAPAKCAAFRGWDPVRNKPRLQHALTARALLTDVDRQDLVLGQIQKALDKDRTILCVGDSIEGIAALRQRGLALGIEDSSVITGDTKRKARTAAIQDPRVVFATSKIFTRGLDRSAFDTLVMASLITINDTFVNQLAGRILRWCAERPEKRPIIMIPVDVEIQDLRLMTARLARKFRALGWTVGGIAPRLIAELAERDRKRER